MPAAYTQRGYVAAGGLMSYGTDQLDMCRQVGVYTGRILNGVRPTDLPVLQSTNLSLSSTFKQRGLSASKCPQACSPSPTS